MLYFFLSSILGFRGLVSVNPLDRSSNDLVSVMVVGEFQGVTVSLSFSSSMWEWYWICLHDIGPANNKKMKTLYISLQM